MKLAALSPAALEAYQDSHSVACAASADFNTDELQRKRQIYANMYKAYHQLQLIEDEGCLRITVESLNHSVTVKGSLDEFFNAFVEPLLNDLSAMEKVIVAMTADLPRLNDSHGTGPTPESTAILALCLPDSEEPVSERCPLLPEVKQKRKTAA